MTPDTAFPLLQGDHALLVFLNVLLQQLGVPLPAVPTMIAAGSLATGHGGRLLLLVLAVLASVIADWAWYLAGRRFGYRVLSGLCRMSINPGSCVTQTEARFIRWGIWSLVVAKFVPGFSTVAPPIAGALRMPLSQFLPAAALGGALWAGAAIVAGWLFREQVSFGLALLSEHGVHALEIFLALAAIWLGWKFWQKYRFEHAAEIPHMTIGELAEAVEKGVPLRLIDLRGAMLRDEEGLIPGATVSDQDGLVRIVADWPQDAVIVTHCACPADASAVKAAQTLSALGFSNVRPLRGGWEAWRTKFAARNEPELSSQA